MSTYPDEDECAICCQGVTRQDMLLAAKATVARLRSAESAWCAASEASRASALAHVLRTHHPQLDAVRYAATLPFGCLDVEVQVGLAFGWLP